MSKASHLVAMFVMVAGSIIVLSACGGSTKKADITPTPPATTGTPSHASSPAATPQSGAITIDQPQQDETVNVPVTVSGSASVFEGALTVAIESSTGERTYCRANTTASEGAPGTGTFDVSLAFPPPPFVPPLNLGARVHVFSLSPKDGSILAEAIVPIKLSGVVPNVVVESPLCGAPVSSPVTVSGTASVFEGSLILDIKDSTGNVLATAQVTATPGTQTPGTPMPGTQTLSTPMPTFSQDLTFSVSSAQQGTIDAYNLSAKDGSVVNLFSVPVLLTP